MSKIYSRKRFILKPAEGKTPNKILIIRRKKIKIFIIIIIIILFYQAIIGYIEPVFETLCEQKVKSIATVISNQESTKVMNKYQYDELYNMEKDEDGNITLIKSNVAPINNLISDLTENIQNRFDELEKLEIKLPLGSFCGAYYFSGFGPTIPAKVLITGTLDTTVKSEFISKGINQTLHRIYVNFECNTQIITPVKNFEKQIINQVIIAEHIIVGHIPETYYNLEGMNSVDDVLNVLN